MAVDDLMENRVRALEEEAVGEQLVTRHILKETRQNSGDLATIKAQITHLQGDMILANAALNNHGVRLDQLTRDVTALRNDVTALRRGQEEIHVRLDGMETRLERVETRLDRMETRFDQLETRLDRMETRLESRFDGIQHNINEMAQNITAILAAVSPGISPSA